MANELQLPPQCVDGPSCANMLRVSYSRLREMISHGDGPRSILIDGWRRAFWTKDIADYLASKAAAHDLKASELRSRADTVRANGPNGSAVYMPSERPQTRGFVSTGLRWQSGGSWRRHAPRSQCGRRRTCRTVRGRRKGARGIDREVRVRAVSNRPTIRRAGSGKHVSTCATCR